MFLLFESSIIYMSPLTQGGLPSAL